MAEYLINAVEVTSNEVAFEVYLNGGRVMRVLDEADGNWMQKGNAFLVQGENEIAINVRPLAGHEDVSPEASVELKIYEGPFGGHPGDAGKVHEFNWYQAATPVKAQSFHTIHQKPFPSRAAQTRWSWEDAAAFAPADRDAIVAVVTALHATLVAKDYDAFAALNVTRDAELAKALDVNPKTLVESDRMMLQSLMDQEDWEVLPLEVDGLEMHPTAGGRLVEVTGANKTSPIVATGAGEQVDFPLTLSNLSDLGWTITR